jgi:predicted RNA polymerase sigma factor
VAVQATDAHLAVDAVWRIESPRLIAGLTRIVRDVGLAASLTKNTRERDWLLGRAGLSLGPAAGRA